MKKTIKTLALITVTVAAVKAFERVQKTKTIKVHIGDIDSYPEWVKRDLIKSKQSYSAVDENGTTTVLADGSVATITRIAVDGIKTQRLVRN